MDSEQFWRDYSTKLYRYALYLTNNRHHRAEDLCANTFLVVVQKSVADLDLKYPLLYLKQILYHLFLKEEEQNGIEYNSDLMAAQPDLILDENVDDERIALLNRGLSEAQSEFLNCHAQWNGNMSLVTEKLKISPNYARRLLQVIREKIAKRLRVLHTFSIHGVTTSLVIPEGETSFFRSFRIATGSSEDWQTLGINYHHGFSSMFQMSNYQSLLSIRVFNRTIFDGQHSIDSILETLRTNGSFLALCKNVAQFIPQNIAPTLIHDLVLPLDWWCYKDPSRLSVIKRKCKEFTSNFC